MDYNHDWSMANIHNVVVALNEGGMLSCDDIMNRVWDNFPINKHQEKINKPTNPAKRTYDQARQQLRQEVRRSLYSHFNDPERHGFDIFRATPHGDVEHFWVAEEQVASVGNDIDFDRLPPAPEGQSSDFDGDTISFTEAPAAGEPVFLPVLSPNAPLIERLNAANNTEFSSAQLLQEAMDNEVVTGTFCNPNMPDAFAEALTETLSSEFVGSEINEATTNRLASRINGILADLEAYNG